MDQEQVEVCLPRVEMDRIIVTVRFFEREYDVSAVAQANSPLEWSSVDGWGPEDEQKEQLARLAARQWELKSAQLVEELRNEATRARSH